MFLGKPPESGYGYMVSYRDPNLAETNEVFEKVPDYLESFDADERDMMKYIIGTVSELDTPLTPRAEGRRSSQAWLTDITFEQIKKQLNRMVEVIKVIDLTDVPIHMKEILFAKVLGINAAEKLEVFQIAQVFHVEVSDVGNDSVLLECKLTERRNNELIALLRSKFKRIEVVRGGAVAIESISTSCR